MLNKFHNGHVYPGGYALDKFIKELETLLPTHHLYLCDNAHNVIKHSNFCHPVLGQDGNIENTKVAEDKKAFLEGFQSCAILTSRCDKSSECW